MFHPVTVCCFQCKPSTTLPNASIAMAKKNPLSGSWEKVSEKKGILSSAFDLFLIVEHFTKINFHSKILIHSRRDLAQYSSTSTKTRLVNVRNTGLVFSLPPSVQRWTEKLDDDKYFVNEFVTCRKFQLPWKIYTYYAVNAFEVLLTGLDCCKKEGKNMSMST